MLRDVTYEELTKIVTDWIKSNANNINGTYPTKDSYTFELGLSPTRGGNNIYKEKAYYTVENPLPSNNRRINASRIDSDMNEYLKTLGSPSGVILDQNFYRFINDMASFCCTKLSFVALQEQLKAVKYYLVYLPESLVHVDESQWQVEFKPKLMSRSVLDSYLLMAEDVNTFWTNLINMFVKNQGSIRMVRPKTSSRFERLGSAAYK